MPPAQRRFGLGQPEGHVHGAVEIDGGRQAGAGLRTPSYLTIQHAKTTAAEMACTPYNLFNDAVRSVSAVDADTPDFRYTLSLQHTKKDLIRLTSPDSNEE